MLWESIVWQKTCIGHKLKDLLIHQGSTSFQQHLNLHFKVFAFLICFTETRILDSLASVTDAVCHTHKVVVQLVKLFTDTIYEITIAEHLRQIIECILLFFFILRPELLFKFFSITLDK